MVLYVLPERLTLTPPTLLPLLDGKLRDVTPLEWPNSSMVERMQSVTDSSTPSYSSTSRRTLCEIERDNGCGKHGCEWEDLEEWIEEEDVRRVRTIRDSLRVSAEGASSSSLSLHPRPVVRPMPPFSSFPSRCLVRLLGVSLESLRCLDEVLESDTLEALEK